MPDSSARPVRQSPAIDPAAPVTLTASSVLSEDLVLIDRVLLDQGPRTLAAFVTSQGQQQALVVWDGALRHLRPSAAGDAGWTVTDVAVGAGPVHGVVAGLHTDGQVHAFADTGSALVHQVLSADGTSWHPAGTFAAVTGLGLAVNDDDGSLLVYGVTVGDYHQAGDLALLSDQSGTWAMSTVGFDHSLGGAQVRLAASGGGFFLFVLGGGTLHCYMGYVPSGPQIPVRCSQPGQPAVELIQAFVGMGGTPTVLVRDRTGQLYACTAQNVTAIPGVTAADACLVVDGDGFFHAYVAMTDRRLVAVHQIGTGSDSAPTWAPVVPLDAGYVRVESAAAGAAPAGKGSRPVRAGGGLGVPVLLFAVTEDLSLSTVTFDPQSGDWTAAPVMLPAPQSVTMSRYRTQLTAADATGRPVPGYPLTVTADSEVAVWTAGSVSTVGPGRSAAVRTNAFGAAVLACPARALRTPALTITGPGLDHDYVVRPDGEVHAYLSGTAPLPGLAPFTGTTLAAATVNGHPLSPLLAGNPKLAATAAQAVTHALQSGGAGPLPGGGAGWALDLSDPAQPVFLRFGTDADVQAYRDQRLRSLDSSWWHDVTNFADDVWHGVERGAIAVETWTATFASDARQWSIDLAVRVTDEITGIATLVIRDIDDAVSVAHSVFAAIEAAAEDVVAWLQTRMSELWPEVMRGADTINAWLCSAPDYLAGQLGTLADTVIPGFFAARQQQMSAALDGLLAQPSIAGKTMGELVLHPGVSGQRGTPAGGPGPGSAPSAVPSAPSDARCGWLLDKVTSYGAELPGFPSSADISSAVAAVVDFLRAHQADFSALWHDFTVLVLTPLKSPEAFWDTPVSTVVGALKDLCTRVLELLDAAATAIARMLAGAVSHYASVLEAPVHVPLVSKLYEDLEAIEHPGTPAPALTLGRIIGLLLALPAVIAYKADHGWDAQLFPAASAALGGPEAELHDQLLDSAAVANAIWAVIDTCLDANPDVESRWIQAVDIGIPAAIQVLTWPGDGAPFASEVPLATTGQKWTFASWMAGWVPVLAGLALAVDPANALIARYLDPEGQTFLWWTGTGMTLTGVVAALESDASAAAVATAFIGPLPLVTAGLRSEDAVESSEGLSAAVKLIIDFFAGMAVTVLMLEG